MNKLLTIVAVALSLSSFVYIFVPDKTVAGITAGATFIISILLFFAEQYIRIKGTHLIDAVTYFFRKSGKYIFKEKVFTYARIGDKEWEAKKQYTIQSKCRALEEIDDRYAWSADSSKCNVLPIVNGQRIAPNGENEIFTLYKVKFEKSVPKGGSIDSGSKITNLIDENGMVKPFLATTIGDKTARLKLVVKIPAQFKPHNARFMIYKASSGKTIYTEDLSYDEKEECFSKSYEYPRKGYRYIISWDN